MAITYGNAIDMAYNEILNFRLQNLATPPATPLDGFVYYDTATFNAMLYANGGWKYLSHVGEVLTTALLNKLNGIATGATLVADSVTNGNIAINGVQNVVYTHPGTGTNPHGTTKTDLSLGNVENKSATTILAELTAAQIATSLGFTPTNITKGLWANIPVASVSPVNFYYATDQQKFYANYGGEWVLTGTTSLATISAPGLMSPEDKTKLDASYTSAQADAAITAAIANLISGAPGALDTLNELAAAMGDDANFATTMTNALANKVDKIAGKQLSTEDYTTAEKTKLSGIATGANNYTHPTGDGNSHVPTTGTTNTNKVLKAGATANSAAWGNVAWGEITGVPSNLAKKYAGDVGDGTATTFVLTHGLNTQDVTVSIRENASPYNGVITDWRATSITQVTIIFAVAPTAAKYRVVVTG